MKRRALLGIVLCTAVLAASYPLLFGLEAYPRQIFYGHDVYSITPVSSWATFDDAFATALANQSWARIVSPEVYAVSSWNGTPVVARGVNPTSFLAIESASLVEGNWEEGNFVLAGEGFAWRNKLTIGSPGVLAGSSSPRITPVAVTGIFHADTPSVDEVLVPLDVARRLAGLSQENLGAIRVQAADTAAMMNYLRSTNASLAVAGNEGTQYLNSPQSGDNRLSSLLFLYPEFWSGPDRSFIQTFAQQGANGVRVVVYTFLVLLSVLAIAGIFSVVWRATAEASRAIGIFRVMGASPSDVLKFVLWDFLVLGSIAIFVGIIAGYIVATTAGVFDVFIVFSHAVKPQFNAALAFATYAVVLVTTIASGIICVRASIRQSPRDLIANIEPRRESVEEEGLPL